MNLISNIKAGSDPEVFLMKDGIIVPSFDLIGGSKVNPRPLGDGFFVQEDNVALEYNIPPATSRQEFITNIFEGLKRSQEVLPDGYVFKIASSHKFTKAQLDHYNANLFGCESDRNAWLGGEFNDKPKVPNDGLRCTGGHFHLGYTCDPELKKQLDIFLVKWMDVYLAVPSMKIDKDKLRRRLYGKAGAYRDKKYGMEYRTLSSFWLASDELTGWVYDQAMKAVDAVNDKRELDDEDGKMIASAVNKSNMKAVDYLCEKYNLAI